MKNLPKNPNDLLKRENNEITHQNAAKAGHRGKDHYHTDNLDKTGRRDESLDMHGNPSAGGSHQSHIYPG